MGLNTIFMGLNERKGKFSACFDLLSGDCVIAEMESAPVFDTEEEAMEGVTRAMAYFREFNRLPNMCVKF